MGGGGGGGTEGGGQKMASETNIRWRTKRETELSNSHATSLGPIKPVQQLVFAK